ncbi:C-factor-like [Pollicipes pollicipes]|uniref:C-factor-like n=1 Tax=Pollicipes pollicipes TaxID=41117 RepID=UPI00188497D1|nr:C-factor-like [Pollicipes pollicipes]
MPFSVLVTGANRGIGLELTRLLVSGPKPADTVFATCRNTSDCKDLQDIQKSHSNLHILQLDVCEEASYPRLVQEVSNVVKDGGLNLLINNAGSASRGRELSVVTSEDMVQLFRTNCVAPLMLTKAFLPLLRAAAADPAFAGDVMSDRRAAVLNINSRMGSIDDNKSGQRYAYRTSKVGLNSVTRSLGIDLRPDHILVVSMDPGWVRTRMGGANGKIAPEESASRILTAMAKMTNQHTSTYVDHFGEPILW